MKSSILNHLDADDRARMVDTLKFILGKLSASASSNAGWGDRGRGHIYFEHLRWFPPEMQDIRLTIDSERTVLRHRFMADGRHRNCIIVENCDGIRPSRGETREDACIRVQQWLTNVEEPDEVGLMEDFQVRRRLAAEALLAAACRLDDGWSSASAAMGTRESEPCVMLGYPDDRHLALYCGSGEPPCDGTLSTELRSALQSGTPRVHLVSTKTVTDPTPTFTFGPPPVIRIRSDDVSPVARLTAIADAMAQGLELISKEVGDAGPQ